LLQKWEEDAQLKQLKQWCKKQTIFRLKGDEPGCWRVIKHTFVPEVKADLQKLYGDELDEIANERFVTP
jgi:hypothetical protein